MSSEDEVAARNLEREERRQEVSSTFGELRAGIRSLNQNVQRLTEVVDRNTQQLNKIEVLEANHNHHGAAIDRAFLEVRRVESGSLTGIARVEKALKAHEQEDNSEHEKFRRVVWFASGFLSAVSIGWTLLGYRINTQIDEMVRTQEQMRVHISAPHAPAPK